MFYFYKRKYLAGRKKSFNFFISLTTPNPISFKQQKWFHILIRRGYNTLRPKRFRKL